MHQASVGFHCPECARQGPPEGGDRRELRTQPVVTMVLVAANLAIFVADAISRGRLGNSLGEWGDDGALFGPAVAAGDWWRPITAGFLHVGLVHVGFNMFLLWQLGSLLEPAVKRIPFTVLYVLSLLGGSFLVLVLSPDSVTVGAWGAVFGLMGAAFVALRSPGIDPFSTGIRPLIVINLLFTFALPGISIGGTSAAWWRGPWAGPSCGCGRRLGPRSPPVLACLSWPACSTAAACWWSERLVARAALPGLSRRSSGSASR